MYTESFPKENRLLSRGDFLYLKSNSKKVVQNPLIIYYKSSKLDSDNTRMGISVSKKFGNACKRNMFKRIVKETFRKSNFKSMGYDLLIVANNKFFNKNEKLFPKELVIDSLTSCLERIKQKGI